MPPQTPPLAGLALTGVGPMPSATTAGWRCARHCAGDGPLVLPGVTDALGARLVEQAGFAAAYATGAGLANAQYGVPDLGLISLGEVVDHVDRLTEATALPVVVDADTGYGGPLAAMRTVRQLERAGAAALQLEDQEMPEAVRALRPARADPGRAHADQDRRRARGPHGRRPVSSRAPTPAASTASTRPSAAATPTSRPEPTCSSSRRRARSRSWRGWPRAGRRAAGGQRRRGRQDPAAATLEGVRRARLRRRALRQLPDALDDPAGAEALAHLRRARRDRLPRATGWRPGEERQGLFHLPEFIAAEAHFDRAVRDVVDGA